MAGAVSEAERIRVLEARVEAVSSLLKSLLTTFVLRGIIFKADIAPLLKAAEEMLEEGDRKALAIAELDAIGRELPGYQRARMGPVPDDDHDH